jgi:hypothetical protein
MYEIGIMNPRTVKRRSKKKARARKRNKRVPAMATKRNKKGRFVKGSTRKRRVKRRHVARKVTRRRAKRHAAVGYTIGSRPIRRRKLNPRRRSHRARRRSNPRFSVGNIGGQLMAGLKGGAGGILNSLLIGFVGPKLPSSINSGYPLHGVRIVGALAIGAAGRRFAGRLGTELGEGAMAVAMYLLLKDVAAKTVPSLPLGDYQEIELRNPGSVLGTYMNGEGSLPAPGMGVYMDGLSTHDPVMEY